MNNSRLSVTRFLDLNVFIGSRLFRRMMYPLSRCSSLYNYERLNRKSVCVLTETDCPTKSF